MPYISYCWSLGTTSFRTREFNKKIEEQLSLIQKFWSIPTYANQEWVSNTSLQCHYYDFLKENGFITGNAARKDKDAREKTSGLVDLGFLDNNRHITNAGKSLLNCFNSSNSNANQMNISNDSYIYLKQMLKVSFQFGNNYVRPLPILAILLKKYDYVTNDEMKFLIPLITSKDKMNKILTRIGDIRNQKSTVDETIIEILLSYPNYSYELNNFLKHPVTPKLIEDIGMNRKSGEYDKQYYDLYIALKSFSDSRDYDSKKILISTIGKINGGARKFWEQEIINKGSYKKTRNDLDYSINLNSKIFNCSNEIDFKKEFFCLLHLNKAKSLLSDYFDLNCRYFKTTNVLIFEDGKIRFDVFPKSYFGLIQNNLFEIAFTESSSLNEDIDIGEIVNATINFSDVLEHVKKSYGTAIKTEDELRKQLHTERYARLNRLIDSKFSNDQLIRLLDLFENREDAEIQNYVTNNADAPTLFEYIVGIIWYKLSGRSGDILSYMNLSLDSDLLPIAHASGGQEDITYKYSYNDGYENSHTCLLEVTLSSENLQRRMEMEPVSRHLGEYKLAHPNEPTYCIFISNFLNINVINDFRNRFSASYYSIDGSKKVDGLMIVPLQTSELKTIIQNNIMYQDIYKLCIEAYQDQHNQNIDPMAWYNQYIVEKINNLALLSRD